MHEALEQEIEALEHLDLHQLRARWQEQFGRAPKFRSTSTLRLLLAWRMQAAVLGGLDARTKDQLRRSGRVVAEGADLGVGARLTREWQGREVVVEVVDDGFIWEGRTFRSLSAAASAIAGTRWNGPRFFGLRA